MTATKKNQVSAGQQRLETIARLRREWVAGRSNPALFDQFHQAQVESARRLIAAEQRQSKKES